MFVTDAKRAIPKLFAELNQVLIDADGHWNSIILQQALARLAEAEMWALKINGGIRDEEVPR